MTQDWISLQGPRQDILPFDDPQCLFRTAVQFDAEFVDETCARVGHETGQVVLGPERYYGDQSTLGGLLLENPRGRRFYPKGPQGTTAVKPTLTILVFRCLGMR